MKPIVVLANWMDSKANLNSETKSRVDKGIQLLEKDYTHLLLMGWACIEDCKIAICDAMKSYCIKKGISSNLILTDNRSKDTVGDAIYSREYLSVYNDISEIAVVTSDYHISRCQIIFDSVYGNSIKIKYIECKTSLNNEFKEKKSIIAFKKTFKGIKDGDLSLFKTRLITNHPLYNSLQS